MVASTFSSGPVESRFERLELAYLFLRENSLETLRTNVDLSSKANDVEGSDGSAIVNCGA